MLKLWSPLLFHVLASSEGKNQSCIDVAIAKAQADGLTKGEQAAVKTLEIGLKACDEGNSMSILFSDEGRCGLGIWTDAALAAGASAEDAKTVLTEQCKLQYDATLCSMVANELFTGQFNDL
jgi:hypothetical protein